MQLGTNLHNDYADFVKGADNEKRVGQARATQKGWLTPFQTAMASGLTLLIGLILGMWFVINIAATTTAHSNEDQQQKQQIAVMVFIVVTSIFNAFAYTGGPWPLGYIGLQNFSLGYSGLGDLFVFLYFGLVATMMPPFLYISCTDNSEDDDDVNNNNLNNLLWMYSTYAMQVATLATNIIVVNNLRDRFTDVLANKLTLAVRFGATFCRVEYGVNIFVAYGITVWRWWSSAVVSNDNTSLLMLLPLLSFPLALKEWQALYKKDGGALNPHVGGAAKVQLLFCILLAISIRISR
jgi:1,4-dihydroxy-2-naphthoate octaprenyltransferase